MQRDSKQPSKPGAKPLSKHNSGVTPVNPPQSTGGTSLSAGSGSASSMAMRKRRPSRVPLHEVRAGAKTAAEHPVLRPKKRAKADTAPSTKTPIRNQRSRLSALDAAAQVLSALTADEAKQGITAQALIERMGKQKLWTSPGGKTPQATLYAAMIREITAKGAAARFRKVSKGHFAAAGSGDSASKPLSRQAATATRKRIKP